MKWGRFILGVAAGAAAGYLLSKQSSDRYLPPEKIIQTLKQEYGKQMAIVGSWIFVQPQTEKIDGIDYQIYQCGLTGLVDEQPHYYEFKVDADSGKILTVQGP